MTELQKPSGPPFTVDRYGSFAATVIAERDYYKARCAVVEEALRAIADKIPHQHSLTECFVALASQEALRIIAASEQP